MEMFEPYLHMLTAYLLGSIPFGLFIGRFFAKVGDVRSQGSGNIGSTNLARVAGKKWGALTLLLDAAKGVAAVLIAPDAVVLYAAFFAVVGHCFPIWLRFKGGKGVATTFGVACAASPLVGGLALATWIAVFLAKKISSLSALAAMVMLPIYAAIFSLDSPIGFTGCCLLISLIVIYRHKENIARLRNKEEAQMVKLKEQKRD